MCAGHDTWCCDTHTITATGNLACFKNRRSEPSIPPASACDRCWVLRLSMGYPPPAPLPPRVFLLRLPHTRSHPAIARDRVASTVSPPHEKHHRDLCFSPVRNTTVTIVSATKETLPPPPGHFHYREGHCSLWDAPMGFKVAGDQRCGLHPFHFHFHYRR